MIILTAGNHKFKSIIGTSVRQAEKFHYTPVVYDLGDLGFGKSFRVENPLFHEKGYYCRVEGTEDRESRALHKIPIIKDCLKENSDFLVYLDGDAILTDSIDEIPGDYDIGVTVRPEEEVSHTRRKFKGTKEIVDGYINAGVMFFKRTPATLRFIDIWNGETEKFRNDQTALNALLKKDFPLEANQTLDLEGIKIRTFDTRIYNYYYFEKPGSENAKILHFKGYRRKIFEAVNEENSDYKTRIFRNA